MRQSIHPLTRAWRAYAAALAGLGLAALVNLALPREHAVSRSGQDLAGPHPLSAVLMYAGAAAALVLIALALATIIVLVGRSLRRPTH